MLTTRGRPTTSRVSTLDRAADGCLSDAAPALSVVGVSLGYRERPVVREASLHVAAGELVGIIGPNGSGKSTLLRGIAGTLDLAAGSVSFDGVDVRRLRRVDLARRLAVVPQSPNLPDAFTVREIVLMGRTPFLGHFQSEGPRDHAVAEQAMRSAGVLDLAERLVGQLSGGERQRVVVARALAQEPIILLLDEPTSHLDPHHQAQVMAVVRERCDRGLAALAVLHDLNLAAQFCDRLILLHEGRVRAEGTPGDVLTQENVARAYGPCVFVCANPLNSLPTVLVVAAGEIDLPR